MPNRSSMCRSAHMSIHARLYTHVCTHVYTHVCTLGSPPDAVPLKKKARGAVFRLGSTTLIYMQASLNTSL